MVLEQSHAIFNRSNAKPSCKELLELEPKARAAENVATIATNALHAAIMIAYEEEAVQHAIQMFKSEYESEFECEWEYDPVRSAVDICGQDVWTFARQLVASVWNIVDDTCSLQSFSKALYNAAYIAPFTDATFSTFATTSLKQILGQTPKAISRSALQLEILNHRLSCVVVFEYFSTLYEKWRKLRPIPHSFLTVSDEHVNAAAADTTPLLVRKGFVALYATPEMNGYNMDGKRCYIHTGLLNVMALYKLKDGLIGVVDVPMK
jgi:hypothetical protein